jgi:DNA-directed RNA polymerase subunit H (RpoH/RPB5)
MKQPGVSSSVNVVPRGGGITAPNVRSRPNPPLRPSHRQIHNDNKQLNSIPEKAQSVSFSELELFANPENLKPPGEYENNNGDEYEYYYEDEEDDNDGKDQFYKPPPVKPSRSDQIDEAVDTAFESQHNQNYGFSNDESQQQQQPEDNSQGQYNSPPNSQGGEPQQPRQHEQVDYLGETPSQTRERIKWIAKLKRQNKKLPELDRIVYDENGPLTHLRRLCQGSNYESKAKMAVQLLRRVTVFISKMVEMLSKRFPDMIGDLEGWSENVYLSLDQYDDLLYDIYDEYGYKYHTNPIILYIFALGTNAMMFIAAKKFVDNPVSKQMMTGLSKMFQKATNVQSRDTVDPRSVPRPTEDPAVPIQLSKSNDIESDSNPLAGIASMFGGDSNMFANLDMDKLMSGIGDLVGNSRQCSDLVGDFRGTPIPDKMNTDSIEVVPMDKLSESDNSKVFKLLRQQQDQLIQINKTDPVSSNVVDDSNLRIVSSNNNNTAGDQRSNRITLTAPV